MSQRPTITSPHAPDFGELRSWLEQMLKALRFLEFVPAMIALVTRMRSLNTKLGKQSAGLRRKDAALGRDAKIAKRAHFETMARDVSLRC